jgi:predicted signal transduction protein with EAL and GGDEF domain
MADLVHNNIVLIVTFTAFDHFIGRLVVDLTEGNIVAELIQTLIIVAPFGFFVMSVMAVQRRLKEQLRHLLETDQLTGLTNRQSFLNRTIQELSKHPKSTVLMIDVDHYKAIKDKHGHFARVLVRAVLESN